MKLLPIYAFPYFPPKVWIEPTNACQLKCIMCPRNNSTYPIGYMQLTLFRKLVDEFTKWAFTPSVKLFFLGEPLLHPQLAEMLAYAYSNGIAVTVQTNGMLLNEENSKWLLQYAKAIALSIDGADAEVYEKIRVGATYQKVVENINRLCKLKKELKSATMLDITTIIPDDDGEASKLLFKMVKFWYNYDLIIAPIQLQKYDGIPKRNQDLVCEDGLKGLIVRWDGKVSFCCGDINTDVVLGDANHDQLETIWRGNELNIIRLIIINRDYKRINVCKNCSITDFGVRNFSLPKAYLDRLALTKATRERSLEP